MSKTNDEIRMFNPQKNDVIFVRKHIALNKDWQNRTGYFPQEIEAPANLAPNNDGTDTPPKINDQDKNGNQNEFIFQLGANGVDDKDDKKSSGQSQSNNDKNSTKNTPTK